MSEPTAVEADGGTIHSNSFKEGRLNQSVDVEDEGSFDHDIDLSSSISSATNNNNLRSSDGDYDDDKWIIDVIIDNDSRNDDSDN